MTGQIPLVSYLVLGDEPYLVAQECQGCHARYFDRRNACAACFTTEFAPVPVARDGTVRTFTIVSFAPPGVDVPFVSAIVDCDGTSVRGNIVNVEPLPRARAHRHGRAAHRDHPIGTDEAGVEAIRVRAGSR